MAQAEHTPLLDAEVKTRVPTEHKQALERLAADRHLKVSDILREAVREKLAAAAQKTTRRAA